MCYECCREFKGWCQSFTRTETLLALLQLVLLIIFISFLVFLILHFIVCEDDITSYNMTTESAKQTTIWSTGIEHFNIVTFNTSKMTSQQVSSTSKVKETTFNKTLECTWSPSYKTDAATRFFEILSVSSTIDTTTIADKVLESTAKHFEYFNSDGGDVNSNTDFDEAATVKTDNGPGFISNNVDLLENKEEMSAESDGEEVGDEASTVVLALVKVKPPTDLIFGCILTIITKHWTLTAASCIESIEEMDTLDAFVMMEDYGLVKKGRSHEVSDVEIHPFYEGVNRSYDLAALKTESNLLKRSMQVELPALFDHFMITIGEEFYILGYGPFRTIDKGPNGKRLRKVNVYTMPSTQCPEESDSWALRHLWGGSGLRRAPCGSAPLCAGSLYARGLACNYCAGTPLLAHPGNGTRTLLYGIMSEGGQCGIACEPQLYVPIALVKDWLGSVIDK